MSQVKEQSGLSNPFARNPTSQVKKPQQAIQKVDTARENVKKQLIEAIENLSDSSIDNVKFTTDQLATEIENMIFELTGKSSKEKSYREKAKKILSRLKGNRNGGVRGILKRGVITVVEFCKLTDKQLDDDSYFDKFINNGNSNTNESKPKSGTKPPNFKNIPIHAIDLSSNIDSVNEYFNSIKPNEEENTLKETNVNEILPDDPHMLNTGVFASLTENNFNFATSNNFEDNMSNRINTTEIDTNSVRTDTFSVREELKEVQPETAKISPRANNGRAIQFNPPIRNINPPTQNRNILNQTCDVVGKKNLNINATMNTSLIHNTTIDEGDQNKGNSTVKNVNTVKNPKDKLQELKKLMEEKKGKNLNMPVNRSVGTNKLINNVTSNNNTNTNIQNINNAEKAQNVDSKQSEKFLTSENQNIPESTSLLKSEKIEMIESVSIETIEVPHVQIYENPIIEPIQETLLHNEIIPHHPHHDEQTVKKNPFDSEISMPLKLNPNPTFKPPQLIINKNIVKPTILSNPHINIPEHQERIKTPPKTIHTNIFSQTPKKEEVIIPKKEHIFLESEINLEQKEEFRNDDIKREVPTLSNLKPLEENSFKILNSSTTSPKLESRSIYNYSNIRNPNNISKDNSIYSMKDKIRNFQETKVSLETGLEFANKKCEVYERELQSLRKTVNDLKVQLSKANEESLKLEIARLKQFLSSREKENEMIVRENQNLKLQAKKFSENMEQMIEENRKFRNETERRFCQFNKELENRQSNFNSFQISPNLLRDNVPEKKEDLEDINLFSQNENNFDYNLFKREKNRQMNSKDLIQENVSQNRSNNVNEVEEVNEEININQNVSIDKNNYDMNNFTNGNPNIIEEVGADNYLNMNGNTYDEMKDYKDDDNLQDHQYYENIQSNQGLNEFTNLEKKSNTGDNFNNVQNNNLFSNNPSKGESGTTTNIFNNVEEEKNQEEDNIFNQFTKPKENIVKPKAEKEKSIFLNKPNNNVGKKNIFDENAFDIFDKADNDENIFETFSSTKKNKNENSNNIFDNQL